jgi:CRISPR/Cas system endoribonuclease Cas6 (RAMP superfamily)
LLFVTPTELKECSGIAAEPRFPVLLRRLAERVRALGCRYQGWSYENQNLNRGAEKVQLLSYEWVHTDAFRRSARNGQIHSIGGHTGWAEYSGSIGPFLPLLELGYWVGVGRQTAWGKGQIRIESFTPG